MSGQKRQQQRTLFSYAFGNDPAGDIANPDLPHAEDAGIGSDEEGEILDMENDDVEVPQAENNPPPDQAPGVKKQRIEKREPAEITKRRKEFNWLEFVGLSSKGDTLVRCRRCFDTGKCPKTWGNVKVLPPTAKSIFNEHNRSIAHLEAVKSEKLSKDWVRAVDVAVKKSSDHMHRVMTNVLFVVQTEKPIRFVSTNHEYISFYFQQLKLENEKQFENVVLRSDHLSSFSI